MLTLNARDSILLVVDIQSRLAPAIERGDALIANAHRLVVAANRLGVPVLFTEQNPEGLGATVPELSPDPANVVHKMTFDAIRTPGLLPRLEEGRTIVMAGCEAHVCILQTALGLAERGRKTFVVSDAVGSRRAENKEAALLRLSRHGIEIGTVEMVLFEWLETAENPCFRDVVALIK
jgi:nicotinamidase-related amidase